MAVTISRGIIPRKGVKKRTTLKYLEHLEYQIYNFLSLNTAVHQDASIVR